MDLPVFQYHPQPLLTGAIRASTATCICCHRARGYIYVGPVHAEGDLHNCICPWCIADGTAHGKLQAEFTDAAGVGGYGRWDKVSEEVITEVAYRTPGFSGWQQEQWFTHCNDATAFLGRVGYKELVYYGPDAIIGIQMNSGVSAEEWGQYLRSLDRDRSPTAYLFKCLHCGQYGGYIDCD